MASLQLLSYPTYYTPVYNPIVYKVFEPSCTLTNFRYKVVVKIQTSTALAQITVGSFIYYPLQDGSCEFDVSKILQDYIVNEYSDYNLAGIKNISNVVLGYSLEWSRIFNTDTENRLYFTNNPQGGPMSNVGACFDGALSFPEFKNWVNIYKDRIKLITNNNNVNASTNTVTSNIPTLNDHWQTLTLKPTDFFTVDLLSRSLIITPGSTNMDEKWLWGIQVQCYSSSYLFGYHTYLLKRNIPSYMSSSPSMNFCRIGIGPANLNAVPDADWFYSGPIQVGLDGAYPLFPTISPVIDYYEIHFLNQNIVECLKPIRINVDKCTTSLPPPSALLEEFNYRSYKNLPQYWLVYKNKYGAYSWLKFFAKNIKNLNVAKELYQKRIKSSSTIYSRGQTTIGSNIVDTYILNSEYVDPKEQDYYEELLASPSVYMLKPVKNDGTAEVTQPLLPVTIKGGDYIIQTQQNNKMMQYTIEVESHMLHNTQRS